MNGPGPVRSRLGRRANTSAWDSASWVLSVAVLAVVIPANEKIAANDVFFAAHGVSPVAWVVVLTIVLVLGWLLLAALLSALKSRLRPERFDLVASLLMLAITWFFVGNALARTVFASWTALGPAVGLVVAAGITLLARRFAMGSALFVFAAVAAALPLVTSVFGGGADTSAGTFEFSDDADRPSVVWVVSDELQYPLAFDENGEVRPELPNLKALSEQSTTFTRAYSAANYTDYAVPSMLTGISDVAGQGVDRMQEVRAGLGIVPGLASEYSVVMESPIYRFDCDSADCASVGSEDDAGVVARYLAFAKDTAAIAGRTALASPFSDAFPSLDGKWRDFWEGGDEFGDNAEGNSVGAAIAGIRQAKAATPDAPLFTFWHTIRTHAPWVVDRDGRQIYPARLPIVEGAHMVGSDKDGVYSTPELQSMERRLYANSAVDFDRQLGELIAELKAVGEFDNTMIVVTADHGAGITVERDRRMGDTLQQRWTEVAHVPLVVKAPGQAAAEVVTEPRSTGQIADSVMAAAGATAPAGPTLTPGLTSDLETGPVFTTIAGGVLTPWVYEGAPEPDPWLADDLTPPDPEHPFAIGIDPALLGAPVPEGSTQVTGARVEAPPGDSAQQLLVVERTADQCGQGSTAGLVVADGAVVGSVLWEASQSPDGPLIRGWAIVPKSDPASYEFWCPAS